MACLFSYYIDAYRCLRLLITTSPAAPIMASTSQVIFRPVFTPVFTATTLLLVKVIDTSSFWIVPVVALSTEVV